MHLIANWLLQSVNLICEGVSIHYLIIVCHYLWTGANTCAYNHFWWHVCFNQLHQSYLEIWMHYLLQLDIQLHVMSHFQLDSVIYCTLIQLGLSVRVSYWLYYWLTKCVDCGWHSVKLHPFIQFEWPPWEFELSWHSCTLHIIVLY